VELAYWIVAGVLAAAFVFAGAFKLVTPKAKLKANGMNWTDAYSQAGVRGIALAEVAGALGVILPPLTGIIPWLAPVAAVGLVAVMVGAIRAHATLHEPVIANVVLGALALTAAVLGFIVWV